MQTLSKPKSLAQDAREIAQSWKAVIDIALHCKSLKMGRGCVVYELKTDVFGFISHFDLQQAGAKELEMDPAIFSHVLELVSNGYDYATEVLLLIKSEDDDQIRYKIEIADLSYDGWKAIPEFADIRHQLHIDQKIAAIIERAKLKAKRTSKKKNKRRK